MVSADMIIGIEVSQGKYGFEATIATAEFADRQKENSDSRTEPLHTTKQVKIAIRKEQQLIKELEMEAEQLENNSSFRTGEVRGEESSKRPKLELESELEKLNREIRSRKFSLKVARAAFAQFMLAGDDENIDLSDVVNLARETCLDNTDSGMEVSEGRLKEMVESMLAMFGLYVKQADNWNFQMGFLMNKDVLV